MRPAAIQAITPKRSKLHVARLQIYKTTTRLVLYRSTVTIAGVSRWRGVLKRRIPLIFPQVREPLSRTIGGSRLSLERVVKNKNSCIMCILCRPLSTPAGGDDTHRSLFEGLQPHQLMQCSPIHPLHINPKSSNARPNAGRIREVGFGHIQKQNVATIGAP